MTYSSSCVNQFLLTFLTQCRISCGHVTTVAGASIARQTTAVAPERSCLVSLFSLTPASGVVLATAMMGLAGVAGLLVRPAQRGQHVAAGTSVIASLLGLACAILALLHHVDELHTLSWSLPFGTCQIGVDPLTAFFLLPVFLVTLCGSLYAVGYLPAKHNPRSAPVAAFFYAILPAAMAMVVLARNGALLLIGWELMALSAFFLLITDHSNPQVRRAGTVYLLTTHTGTAALIIFFSLLNNATGSFSLPPAASLACGSGTTTVMFLLALFGFGAKSGLMPMHFWLPSAHANAPSHASAMMSGVMLKMGLYGLLRFLTFVPDKPAWWGWLLLGLGLASAVLGIAFAALQTDIKRALACSSIENIGIIVAGIGMFVVGQASSNPSLAFLGLAGALLHILNHSLFKPLLFLGAGGIIHATGTRVLSRMGGLAKTMKTSSLLFFVGAVAIAGLPPLNGFASEFLLYTGLLREAMTPLPLMALGVPALGFAGGLAALTFVKLYGIVYLGPPRAPAAQATHELPITMLIPMGLLAALCVVSGLVPAQVLALVQPVVRQLSPLAADSAALPEAFAFFPWIGLALMGAAATVWLGLRSRLANATRAPTWGCGYLAPTPRMQYSAAGFSELWASLSGGLGRGAVRKPGLRGVAPGPTTVAVAPVEFVLERIVRPAFTFTAIGFSFLRRLQHGRLHVYVLYIFITLLVLMLSVR